MEFFDIVDEDGTPTGEKTERKTAHSLGIRHRTVHVWIVREKDGKMQALFQKRAACKDSFPGRYDTSSAGHITFGDEPIDSAIRELFEELGIKADRKDMKAIGKFRIQYEKEFHGKLFRDNEIAFVFLYDKAVDEKNVVLQKDEVEEVRWFCVDEAYEKRISGDKTFCTPLEGLEIIKKYLSENKK